MAVPLVPDAFDFFYGPTSAQCFKCQIHIYQDQNDGKCFICGLHFNVAYDHWDKEKAKMEQVEKDAIDAWNAQAAKSTAGASSFVSKLAPYPGTWATSGTRSDNVTKPIYEAFQGKAGNNNTGHNIELLESDPHWDKARLGDNTTELIYKFTEKYHASSFKKGDILDKLIRYPDDPDPEVVLENLAIWCEHGTLP